MTKPKALYLAIKIALPLPFVLAQILVHRNEQPCRPPHAIRFAQITDAHILDAGKTCYGDDVAWERSENLAAFRSAVAEIKTLDDASRGDANVPPISFVVFTGDMGLEYAGQSPRKAPEQRTPCRKGGDATGDPGPLLPVTADDAAQSMIDLLAPLRETIPVFVLPGNNDLPDEDPAQTGIYADFVRKLQDLEPGRFRDLSDTVAPQPSGPGKVFEGLTLMGMNTASFKPARLRKQGPGQENDPKKDPDSGAEIPGTDKSVTCVEDPEHTSPATYKLRREPGDSTTSYPWMDARAKTIQQLAGGVAQLNGAPYVLFTHVPDVADPVTVCGLGFRYRSSWFLNNASRKAWTDLANSPQMVATFAGHFHSPDRSWYARPLAAEPVPDGPNPASKTFIAPPLAIKFQVDKESTARGMMLVDIVKDGGQWIVPTTRTGPIAPPRALWLGEQAAVKELKRSDCPKPSYTLVWILDALGALLYAQILIFPRDLLKEHDAQPGA